jgi:hypothetical protein
MSYGASGYPFGRARRYSLKNAPTTALLAYFRPFERVRNGKRFYTVHYSAVRLSGSMISGRTVFVHWHGF